MTIGRFAWWNEVSIRNLSAGFCPLRASADGIVKWRVPVSIVWLRTRSALIAESLYWLRYLHRGSQPVRTAIEFLVLLRVSLSAPTVADST